MKRADCVAALYPELGDRLVVTIMGATAQELYDLGHRETFFYLQHAMGLASSIGTRGTCSSQVSAPRGAARASMRVRIGRRIFRVASRLFRATFPANRPG